MKLSAAITSRDLNSGSANFIDDIRSFKMSHSLSTPTNQQDTKCGYLKFTFFVGDKMAKIEHEIGQFKEIDILEIEDEITAEYMEAMQELEKSNKVPKELTGLISVLDSDKETDIMFLDLSLSREKYYEEGEKPFSREYSRKMYDKVDPIDIFWQEGKSADEAELDTDHIRIKKTGDDIEILKIGEILKEKYRVNLIGMKLKKQIHYDLYNCLNHPFLGDEGSDWYDLSGHWLLKIDFWLHRYSRPNSKTELKKDEKKEPFSMKYNIKDPHIIFTKEGKTAKEVELNAEHIRIKKIGNVIVIFEIGKTLKETECIEPNTKKKIKVDNLVGMKIKENFHGELYETLNEPFVLGKATDWYDLSGRWLLRIVSWLHSHYLLSEEIFYSSKKE